MKLLRIMIYNIHTIIRDENTQNIRLENIFMCVTRIV